MTLWPFLLMSLKSLLKLLDIVLFTSTSECWTLVLILFDAVLQVHKLFALLNLSHAYVTTLGRLVGVVALKEVSRDHADSRAIFL